MVWIKTEIDGEDNLVIQERWKELPEVIELEFTGRQRSNYELSNGHPNLMMLNIKATPNQIKVLKQFEAQEVSAIGPDGKVESVEFTEDRGLVHLSPGRGYRAFGFWTRSLPSPDSLVKLRLVPARDGGELK